MADVKISALPASTTPLDGTEVLPVVQGTTTKQVSIANVTAGRAINVGSMTVGSGTTTTAGFQFVTGSAGVGTGYGGIYAAGVTPNSANFAFTVNAPGTFPGLNAVAGGSVTLGVNNVTIATTSSTGVAVTGLISATTTVKTGGYTVAGLPTVGTVGRRAYVTNALSPAYGATVVGGGAVITPVFDNGTAWIVA